MSIRNWFAVIVTLLSMAFGCGLVSIAFPQLARGGAAAGQPLAADDSTQDASGKEAAASKVEGNGQAAEAEAAGQEGKAADPAQGEASSAKVPLPVEAPPRPDREPYRPIDSTEVERARRTLRERLDGFLQRLSSDPAPVRDGWKRFVQTDLIESAVGAAQFDSKLNQTIRKRLFSDKAGMEFTPVLALRRAYEDFAELQEVAGAESPADLVGRLQDEARTRMETLEATGANYELSEIGTRIGRLRRLKQAPKLVESLDSRFSRENLFVRATQRLIAAGVEQDVDESSAVTDSILGVSVIGDARLRGRVTLGMVPSEDRGRFELLLNGKALSSSTGYRGSVTLFSTSTTAVMARKTLELDERGLTGDPAVAACSTDNSLNDIAAKCCLIERIAWKRAQQSQGQAEALASASAERRIESRMDARAADLMANANKSYQDNVRKPLLRRDGFPQALKFQTTTEHLLGRLLQRNNGQLAAPTDPPAPVEGGDLSVRIHESYVRNMGESAVGGYRLTDVELEKLYKDNGREVPEELQVTDTSTRWGFTFAPLSPIEIKFRENQLLITVTASEFASGERTDRPDVRRLMRISATYKFEQANGIAEFVRQEDYPSTEYVPVPGRGRESLREVTVKRLMARKFNAMLKKRLPASFALPGRWAAGGQLVAKGCVPASEWLSMAWEMAPLAAVMPPAKPEPAQEPAKPETAQEPAKPEPAQEPAKP